MNLRDNIFARRLKKKLTVGSVLVTIILAAFYILIRMAFRSSDFSFNYWPLDMQFAGLILVLAATWELLMTINR